MTTVVLIHGGTSTVKKLEAAMPGAQVALVYEPGLSTAYDERTGIASKFPTLRELLAHYAPWWSPGDPLVILGYSAGGWALRHYLRDPAARRDVSAAVFLDSTYGNSGETCAIDRWLGVVEYAKEANLDPGAHRLVMTYSQAHPGPRVCATAIERAAGAGSGVFVRGYNNADHGAQQGVVGPAIVSELVAPWIGQSSSRLGVSALAGLGLLAVGGVLVWLSYD